MSQVVDRTTSLPSYTSEFEITCRAERCGATFNTRFGYDSHQQMYHEIQTSSKIRETGDRSESINRIKQTYYSILSPNEPPEKRLLDNCREEIISKAVRFKCPQCPFIFTSQPLLFRHLT